MITLNVSDRAETPGLNMKCHFEWPRAERRNPRSDTL